MNRTILTLATSTFLLTGCDIGLQFDEEKIEKQSISIESEESESSNGLATVINEDSHTIFLDLIEEVKRIREEADFQAYKDITAKDSPFYQEMKNYWGETELDVIAVDIGTVLTYEQITDEFGDPITLVKDGIQVIDEYDEFDGPPTILEIDLSPQQLEISDYTFISYDGDYVLVSVTEKTPSEASEPTSEVIYYWFTLSDFKWKIYASSPATGEADELLESIKAEYNLND